MVDVALGPEATLVRSTSVLHPPPGALVKPPYHVAVAMFAEGIAVMGLLQVDALDEAPPGAALLVVPTEVGGLFTYGFAPT